MIRIIATLAIAMLLSGCGQENSGTAEVGIADKAEAVEVAKTTPQKHSGLLPDYMNSNVRGWIRRSFRPTGPATALA
jgi:PBP1b-binding outer membrane lipoprotein LpoB